MGYLLKKRKCEPAPLLLAVVLKPILEQNFTRALQVSLNDPFVFILRPTSLALLIPATLFPMKVLLPAIWRAREVAF